MKRVLVPLLAAAAVLALVLVVFAVTRGDGGSDQVSFGSGDTAGSDGSDGVVGDGVVGGVVGDGVPGDPGSAEPTDPAIEPMPDGGADVQPTPSGPLAVPIESYYQYGARRLALRYYIGVPECYGTIDEPVVEETADAVVVTLTRVPPETNEDVACIEIALQKSVDITLAEPLGDRRVLDGSFEPPVKVRESARPPKESR